MLVTLITVAVVVVFLTGCGLYSLRAEARALGTKAIGTAVKPKLDWGTKEVKFYKCQVHQDPVTKQLYYGVDIQLESGRLRHE